MTPWPLTQRETEALTLTASGLSGSEIAQRWGCSRQNVRAHMHQAYAKLGAKNAAQAAVMAERARISEMCLNMSAVSWNEWDQKADPIDQGKAIALEHVAALLENP